MCQILKNLVQHVTKHHHQKTGVYEDVGQFLNVNRGFGFIGYPGRVGIWPEVSVIQLKKRRNTA